MKTHYPKFIAYLSLFFFCIITETTAQVTVTPSSPMTKLCVDAPTFTTLGDIVIDETANSDFVPGFMNRSYTISVPSANFIFNTGTPPTLSPASGDISSIVIDEFDADHLTIEYTTDGTGNSDDQIRIIGLQIKAINTSDAGDLVRSGGNADQVGNNGTNASSKSHGLLVSSPMPTINGLATAYCANDPLVTLYGSPAYGTFTNGNGVTDQGAGSAEFDPGAAGAGTVTYSVSSGICIASVNVNTTIKSVPNVSFNSPTTLTYTSSSPPVNLAGSPGGGIFSGQAVSGNKFYPQSAGIGSYQVIYTYTNALGCSETDDKTFTVVNGGNVFPCLPSELCSSTTDIIQLNGCGFNPNLPNDHSIFDYVYYDFNTGTWTPIPGTVAQNRQFVPSNYPTGGQYVGYRVCADPCTTGTPAYAYAWDYQYVYIQSASDNVYFYQVPDLCTSSPVVNLATYGNPPGGSFSCSTAPSAISGASNFNPANAGAGPHTITYNPPTGACGGPKSVNITVNSTPYFTGADITYSSRCYEDSITLTALSAIDNIPNPTTVTRWQWKLDSNFPFITTTDNVKVKFLTPGNHDIQITAISDNSNGNTCTAVITKNVDLGSYPNADFEWQNICYDLVANSTTTKFKDSSSISFGSITRRNWYFGEGIGDITGATNNTSPNHQYLAPGTFNASLVAVSSAGCRDSISHVVNILPKYRLQDTLAYSVAFRDSTWMWGVNGKNVSWTYAVPNPVSKPYLGTIGHKVWVTHKDSSYNEDEQSYLNSPCFNLRDLDKPMITIKFKAVTNEQIAGAILESSNGSGKTWKKVGSIGDGLNWYNKVGIIGKPGNPNFNPANEGWSGYDTSTWRIARINLPQFANDSNNVRFRVSFGSPQITTGRTEGFAVDSVWLGNKNKVVLIEHFTNTATSCFASDTSINYIRKIRPKDVAVVNYHAAFPQTDIYNLANQADASSRIFYHNVSNVPWTYMDGNAYSGNVYKNGSPEARIDVSDVDVQGLEKSLFKMDLTTDMNTPGQVKIGIRTTYIDALPFNSQMALQVIVVQDSADGNNNRNSVLREMLPNASGTFIGRVWNYKDSLTHYFTWNHTLTGTPKLGVVAFLQNPGSKEVYQAVYQKGTGTSGNFTGTDDAIITKKELSLYPNPASGEALVMYKGITAASWELTDNLGQVITQGKPSISDASFVINTSAIESGLYYVKVSDQEGNSVVRKLVIQH